MISQICLAHEKNNNNNFDLFSSTKACHSNEWNCQNDVKWETFWNGIYATIDIVISSILLRFFHAWAFFFSFRCHSLCFDYFYIFYYLIPIKSFSSTTKKISGILWKESKWILTCKTKCNVHCKIYLFLN